MPGPCWCSGQEPQSRLPLALGSALRVSAAVTWPPSLAVGRSRSAGLPGAHLESETSGLPGSVPLSSVCLLVPAVFRFLGTTSQGGFTGGDAVGASGRTVWFQIPGEFLERKKKNQTGSCLLLKAPLASVPECGP